MQHKCVTVTGGEELVCSHALTAEMLTGMGFPVRRTTSSMGSVTVLVEGQTFERARHAAWAAGFTRLCTMRG